MKGYHKEIMALDMGRVGKNYAAVAAVLLVACVSLGAFLLWPQLGEGWRLFAQGVGPLDDRLDLLEDAWEWSLAGYDGGISAVGLGARTALLMSGLVVAALFAGYWLLVALWLYQLAARAEMGALFWGLAALAGNLAAVALFFALRSVLRAPCPACGQWTAKAGGYCRHCGAALAHYCPSCGAVVAGGDSYCGHCGTSLSSESA